MIDIHCHILPGVDDGAQSLEESLLMARRAVEDGIKTIVATPHTLNGITPIISHLERNLAIQHDIDILYELVSMGALYQVTAMSITRDFGGTVMQCTERPLRHRLVHIIASDAYSSDSRPPVLSQAVEAAAEILGNYDDAERMVKEVPALIFSGGVPDIPEPKGAKRGMI